MLFPERISRRLNNYTKSDKRDRLSVIEILPVRKEKE